MIWRVFVLCCLLSLSPSFPSYSPSPPQISEKKYDLPALVLKLSERLCYYYSEKMVAPFYKSDSTDGKKYIVNMHDSWITFWKEYDGSSLPEVELTVLTPIQTHFLF